MCIIIYKPADAALNLSTVLRAYQRNDDGWGILAWTPDGIEVRRGFGGTADETLLDAYDALREYPLVLHCRIRTSGKLNLENTHPFQVRENIWLFHNGAIEIDCSTKPDMCDSYHVAQSFATNLGDSPSEALRNPEYVKAMEDFACTSKLVFCDSEGVVIVNETLGYWEGGCWFSNDSADPNPKRSTAFTYNADLGFPDDAYHANEDAIDDAFVGDYYDGIVPRCYRIETQEDEDGVLEATMNLIGELKKLDVDDIAYRCLETPELCAEALYLLVNSRQTVA